MVVRSVEYRGDIPLSYPELLKELESYRTFFQSLRFAAFLLDDCLKRGIQDNSYNVSFTYYTGEVQDQIDNKIDQSKIVTTELQSDVVSLFNIYRNLTNKNTQDAIDSLRIENLHFLRSQFVNSIFEIINKYIEKYKGLFLNPGHGEHLKTNLRKSEWYDILYIIRNHASHYNGVNTKFKTSKNFGKPSQVTFRWKNISITEGMFWHELRYNDLELLDLYDTVFSYIKGNKELFTTSYKGTILPELL